MSQSPLDGTPEPRAASYGRGNQAAGRYQPVKLRCRELPGAPPVVLPARRGLNWRRIWLLSMALVLALALGFATLSVALGGPAPVALAPEDTAAPPPGPPVGPPDGAQKRLPAWDQAATGRPSSAPPGSDRRGAAAPTTAAPPGGNAPAPSAQPGVPGSDPYKNCGQARKAGAVPLLASDPGYSPELDKDGDGVACEKKD